MLYQTLALFAFTATSVLAQRPSNTSICDYYTTALLKNNTAANQHTLLTLLVNTAVIGNYTTPNVGIAVPGILAPGKFNGTDVNLLPFFSGGLASTNRGGESGVATNFLDDGGATPLMKNMPANGKDSNQFTLLTHLYEYFGVLLGCSFVGKEAAYPAYDGDASMYETHKFMKLDPHQVGYFITQVGLSAASFGVASEDVAAVGTALSTLFGHRCSPPTTVVPSQGDQLQAICTEETCPLSPNPVCGSYANVSAPVLANASSATGAGTNGTNTASGTIGTTATGSSPSQTSVTSSTGSAAKLVGSFLMMSLALFAFML